MFVLYFPLIVFGILPFVFYMDNRNWEFAWSSNMNPGKRVESRTGSELWRCTCTTFKPRHAANVFVFLALTVEFAIALYSDGHIFNWLLFVYFCGFDFSNMCLQTKSILNSVVLAFASRATGMTILHCNWSLSPLINLIRFVVGLLLLVVICDGKIISCCYCWDVKSQMAWQSYIAFGHFHL